MTNQATENVTKTAAEICLDFELTRDGRAVLRDDMMPGTFLSLLEQKQLYKDAIRFVAYLLPKRQAVWWGCLCVWETVRPTPPATIDLALQAAVRWVQEPSEENRRAAEAPGKAVGVSVPAGAVALAAFWSGGSMSRPDLPIVPPPPLLTAKTIAGALVAAAEQGERGQLADRYRRFLALARDVDGGKNRWE